MQNNLSGVVKKGEKVFLFFFFFLMKIKKKDMEEESRFDRMGATTKGTEKAITSITKDD